MATSISTASVSQHAKSSAARKSALQRRGDASRESASSNPAAKAAELVTMIQTSRGERLRTEPAYLIDQLGLVKAQIAELEEQEANLRDQIIGLGVEAVEGELFRATVSQSEVTKVDYKAICEKCQPSHQLVAAHTSMSDRITVKVVSR